MSKILEEIASSALKRLHKKYEKSYPQLAVFNLDVIGRTVLSKGWYEREVLECLKNDVFAKLSTRRLAVDVGANIGNHTIFFSNCFEKVISFEPNPKTFELLRINAQLNTNIEVHNIGCSSTTSNLIAKVSSSNLGGASLHDESGDEQVKFCVAMLDDLIPESQHHQIDFIKLDIEKHEAEALRGAKRILDGRAVVAFECSDNDSHDFFNSEVAVILGASGYTDFYALADQTPLANVTKRGASLLDAIFTLLTGRRIARQKFKLQLIKDHWEKRFDGHLVVAFKRL